jgi:phosphoribosyl 1,2-cyclic phosphodiesterase
MTLRFASLSSGSRGNALLVEYRDTLVMVDCGLTLKATHARLAALGRDPSDITALVVTHEHGDHIGGVARLSRRYSIPVAMTPGTRDASGFSGDLQLINCHRVFRVGDLSIQPFPVPHDAREPCQFVFGADGKRLGLLTDTGHITPHITSSLSQCDALAIEANHDLEALAQGPYPSSLKHRVGGAYGHLNNEQTAALIRALKHDGLQWVTALHLSEQNNDRDTVRGVLSDALSDAQTELHLASQDEGCDWLTIS